MGALNMTWSEDIICPNCGSDDDPVYWDRYDDGTEIIEIYLCSCGCKFKVHTMMMYKTGDIIEIRKEE